MAELKAGTKLDQGKPDYSLLPTGPLEGLVKTYAIGVAKYERDNWRKGLKWSRIFGALMRHLWAFWRGEDLDSESGLPHVLHAAWGCFTLAEYMKTRREFDDRFNECPKPGTVIPCVDPTRMFTISQ